MPASKIVRFFLAVLVIGGSGKDIGKTALVCAVISALREWDWTAVKITAHDYGLTQSGPAIFEPAIHQDAHPGKETDTARYLAAGAGKALLVTRRGSELPVDTIAQLISTNRNIIFESNRIGATVKPDICLALIGGHERKPSFDGLLRVADAIITRPDSHSENLPGGIPRFNLVSLDPLPPELVSWLKQQMARIAM